LQVHQEFCKDSRTFNKPLESAKNYEWDGACDKAFETLKDILVKAPVLKLSDFDKDFEIHFDASDFVIGGVLVQEGDWWHSRARS
jgi:hypothetical protein